MNRRVLLSQLTAGLTLQFIPASLIAGATSTAQTNGQPTSILFNKAVNLIQTGLIGLPERLTVSHVYSPKHTSLPALLSVARQDFELAGRLLGSNLEIDAQSIFIKSPSAAFGSYSARFDRAGTAIIWQALARIGGQATKPTGTLRISGSEGILQIDTDGSTYQIVDFRGRIVRQESRADFAANQVGRRSFLGA